MSSQPGKSNRGKRGGKTKATRTSEPGPGPGLTLKERLKPASKSVGNSPASSPLLSRKVLTRTSIESSSPLKSLDDTSLIDLTGISAIDLLTQPDVDLQTGIIDEVPECPCALPLSKNSVFIKCTGCSQDWHCSCVNLAGITAAAVKKLASWKCPRCYSSPFSRETNKSNQIAFEEFKVSEEFSEHSERITVLEKGLTDIKGMLEKLPSSFNKQCNDEFSLHYTDITEELKSVRQHMGNLGLVKLSSDVTDLKDQIKKDSDKSDAMCCEIRELKQLLKTDKITPIQSSQGSPEFVTSVQTSTTTAGLMQPNTTSPHHQERITHKCDPFTMYKDDVVSLELNEALTGLTEREKDSFTTIGSENSRDVMYFGEYSYRYSGGEHAAKPLPEEVKNLIASIRPILPNPEMPINSCLVSRYQTGLNSIPPHRDNEPVIDPESDIITVSIGAERQMTFADNNGSDVRHQTLLDRSMLVSSRFAQDFWLHSIDSTDSVGVRYSFTLRHVDPHFINSTVILGDSNTTNVKFGSGIGTLGAWMPGRRIKVGHIEAIPVATDIGPYRNIVIHTGINSINSSPRFRKSNKALIDNLECKIRDICETYPKAKVFISLLLPTRIAPLNYRIRDFNNLIMDMTCRLSRVCIIEHSLLGDTLSNDHGRWKPSGEGSNNFVPKVEDSLHLGKLGIRLLANSIKQAVVGKTRSQSEARFTGGRGGFRSAAERGIVRQGDHQSH